MSIEEIVFLHFSHFSIRFWKSGEIRNTWFLRLSSYTNFECFLRLLQNLAPGSVMTWLDYILTPSKVGIYHAFYYKEGLLLLQFFEQCYHILSDVTVCSFINLHWVFQE